MGCIEDAIKTYEYEDAAADSAADSDANEVKERHRPNQAVSIIIGDGSCIRFCYKRLLQQ